MKTRIWLLPLIFLALAPSPALSLAAEPEVKFVDVDTLKGMLGDSSLLIIDARHGTEWTKSDRKIEGAMRFSQDGIATWGPLLPKNRKIVMYCS